MSDETGKEIATIQEVMRTDFAAYQRDEAMQGRYLGLLRAQEAGAPLAPVPAADRELAEIQAAMRDLNSAYYKGEKITKDGRTETKMAWRYYDLLKATPRADASPSSTSDGGLLRMPTRAEIRTGLTAALGREPTHVELSDEQGRVLAISRVASDVVINIPAETRGAFVAGFDALPAAVARATAAELAAGRAYGGGGIVTERNIAKFSTTPEGKALVGEWRGDAAQKIGQLRARLMRWLERMDDASQDAALRWLDGLAPAEAKAIYRAMVA